MCPMVGKFTLHLTSVTHGNTADFEDYTEKQQETDHGDYINNESNNGNSYGFDEEYGVLPPAASMVNVIVVYCHDFLLMIITSGHLIRHWSPQSKTYQTRKIYCSISHQQISCTSAA
jgi:hypothetical protein